MTARLGLGTAPLGNLFEAVSTSVAVATVRAAWEAGVRCFDTAPQYGHGLAEVRLGVALAGSPRDGTEVDAGAVGESPRDETPVEGSAVVESQRDGTGWAGVRRDEIVVASKVGRLLRRTDGERPATVFRDVPDVDPVFDFSRDGVLRSLEESLQRLGLDRLDVVHVHDPDDHEDEAMAAAFPALIDLREQGVIGRVGCGMNQVAMLGRFVERVDLDCILLAGRYTLLDRQGAGLLDRCAELGVEVFVGGVFNSGLLARPEPGATFDYAVAPPALVARARRLSDVCAAHGVELPAAALQFVARHPAVTTVLVGARSPQEVLADVGFFTAPLPDALWSDLDAATGQD